MHLELAAPLLPRLVLCLCLLAAATASAQGPEAPPPAPSSESSEPPTPSSEFSPREQHAEEPDTARFVGRLLLLPPAALLGGGVGVVWSTFSIYPLALLGCDLIIKDADIEACFEATFYPSSALGVSAGATLGAMAVGYLLDGNGRVGVTAAGALAGGAAALGVYFAGQRNFILLTVLLFASPALGATVAYVLSDAFFPEPRRAFTPRGKKKVDPEDEYARILPLIGPLPGGGLIGGLAGRF